LKRFLICLALQSRFTHIVVHSEITRLSSYLVGKDQSADEHLCIKTAGYEALAEGISYTAASHATRAISLFRLNPSYFSPPSLPPALLLPSYHHDGLLPSPSIPRFPSSPLSRLTTTGALLSSLGQRDFIKLLLHAHRRHFAFLPSPSSLLPALCQLLHAKWKSCP